MGGGVGPGGGEEARGIMGTAVYYMKVKFRDGEAMREKAEAVAAFLDEGKEAKDYWQSCRHWDPKYFWPEFREKFPTVYRYLETVGAAEGDCNNGLAGLLEFPENVENTPDGEIWLSGEVWHFADWDPLKEFVVLRFGAVEAPWLSDEHISPFDLL